MQKRSKSVKVTIGSKNIPVGLLRFESDSRRESSAFEYDPSWLEASYGFDLSPSLPRQEGPFFSTSTSESKRTALPGAISDATPDSWGRSLMSRALGGGLTEFEYLTLSDDRTRQGALRYLDDNGQQMQDPDRPLSRRNIPLEELRRLALAFDKDAIRAKEEARDLVGAVGSLGGARPKANVISDDGLYIAKFTSQRDSKPIERVEVATLNLARDAGLHAASAELVMAQSEHPIALIRRFDRRAQIRIPYISARTSLGDADSGTYDQLALVIRKISKDPKKDMREIFGRIAFTILVSNTDDHLKNHGFLYLGDNRWGLSPAFDINPQVERQRTLETSITELSGNDSSIEALIEASPFFDLTEDEGLAIASGIGRIIDMAWRPRLAEQGVTGSLAKYYEAAFQNEQSVILRKMASKGTKVQDPFTAKAPGSDLEP